MKIRCLVCLELAQRTWSECVACGGRVHVGCLAEHYLAAGRERERKGSDRGETPPALRGLPRQPACLPDRGTCPHCHVEATWSDVLSRLKTAGWRKQGKGERGGSKGHAISSVCGKAEKREGKEEEVSRSISKTRPIVSVATVADDDTTTTTPLEALIRRTGMLQIDERDTIDGESLASRLLRRLQEQEGDEEGRAGAAGEQVVNEEAVIDLCSSSEDGGDVQAEMIDLASD